MYDKYGRPIFVGSRVTTPLDGEGIVTKINEDNRVYPVEVRLDSVIQEIVGEVDDPSVEHYQNSQLAVVKGGKIV